MHPRRCDCDQSPPPTGSADIINIVLHDNICHVIVRSNVKERLMNPLAFKTKADAYLQSVLKGIVGGVRPVFPELRKRLPHCLIDCFDLASSRTTARTSRTISTATLTCDPPSPWRCT